MIIVKEIKEDYREVESIVEMAFKSEEHSDGNEHNLVAKLRDSKEFVEELSLVAKEEGKIIGHILLTKIKIKSDNDEYESLALAPLSVHPKYQGMGIGRKLIEASFDKAKELGFRSVIVLGHENYYPKFGFEAANKYSIRAPFEVPENVFMAKELVKNGLKGISGTVIYSDAFL
ncbi:N-acetyltransferase [Romboutsia weinsteinii]|uniref:N-acetyltransferase n=1 Tax=Romboutsia weinsteinii TaxID=2020949 RepID=A0A371IXP7_9FIRM|nr:N-acetyltransferase [Romboutsia weinsteinii]RDY25241.1 N-acetyltransferase [Romboutsia weinsteinii]